MPASTFVRERITAIARSERLIGAEPDGPPRHFCRPAVAASRPQPSISKSLPPSEAVASV